MRNMQTPSNVRIQEFDEGYVIYAMDGTLSHIVRHTAFIPKGPKPDSRRLRKVDAAEVIDSGNFMVWRRRDDKRALMSECVTRRLVNAYHADGSETDHMTRLEAHDALVASGSESPFEVVRGVIPKPVP